jgi:hypothetical protein
MIIGTRIAENFSMLETRMPHLRMTPHPIGVYTPDLSEVWLDLFRESKSDGQIYHQVVEAGYSLVVIPASALAPGQSLQDAFQQSSVHLPRLTSGRLVRLEKLDSYGLLIAENYRVWAAPFASDLDAGLLHAGAYVDIAIFKRSLWGSLQRRGLAYEEPSSGAVIIRDPFRHWVNVARAIVEMVMMAQHIDQAVERLVSETHKRLEVYEQYLDKLIALFPGHYWGIDDNHFAVWDGQSQTAVGINYWALGETEEEMDRRFLETVLMVKKLLPQVTESALIN